MARKPTTPRTATAQFNLRMTAEEAAIVRAAIPRGGVMSLAVRLLLEEARARLVQDHLSDLDVEGRQPAA